MCPIMSQQNYCSLISADTSLLIENFEIPFETKTGSLKLVGEIDGLLLLTDLELTYAKRELYLWNPYVRRHRVLVSSCFKKFLDSGNESCLLVGMGFDKVTNDYKVVRIVYVKDDKGMMCGEVAPKVEVYSLRKNTWRKMKDVVVPIVAKMGGTYVDGSFYWLEKIPEEEARMSKRKEVRLLNITKNETLILEEYSFTGVGFTNLVSCNLKSRECKDLGFGMHGVRPFRYLIPASSVDTSFPESLIMYEGGKLLLEHAN